MIDKLTEAKLLENMEVIFKIKDQEFSLRFSRNHQMHEIIWLISDWIDIHPVFIKIIGGSKNGIGKNLEPKEY